MPEPSYAKSDDIFGSAYSGLQQASGYEFDSGLIALPIASSNPDEPPVIIRCHAPVTRRRVDWSAMKQGKPPVVPAPETQSGSDVFMAGFVAVPMPALSPQMDGFHWKVGGSYTYVCATPKTIGEDNLPTGAYPFTIGKDLNVRRSLTASDNPASPGNTMTSVDLPYLHTDFPAFCFDVGLIT